MHRWPGSAGAGDLSDRHWIIRRLPFRNVLAVFPHPDDEAITCGGTLSRLSKDGATVTVLILTAGERGNPSGRLDESLKTVRTSEAEAAARILGVSRLAVADFRDGAVQLDRDRARAYLADFLTQLRPDLVITFDRAGLDGHPDHVACSDILTELRQAQFHHVRLWYVALPPALLVFLSIVGQMKRTEWLMSRRVRPTHRLFVGPEIVTKSRALRAHRSQRRAIGKGLGRAFPTWLMIGLLPFEYFAEAS